MSEHYYTAEPSVEHDEKTVVFETIGVTCQCVTDSGVFSRDGLDMGTRVLLEALPEFACDTRVLDLGCGWGPVSVVLGKKYPGIKLTLTDINERAVTLAKKNLIHNGVTGYTIVSGDGFDAVEGKFSAILLNPPIRTGKTVIYGMFQNAADFLAENGKLYIVIRKQQGAESAEKFLKTVYHSVERIAREKGYWVFECAEPVTKA